MSSERQTALAQKLERLEISCERLYRIDLEQGFAEADAPGDVSPPTLLRGKRPTLRWEVQAMIKDLHNRSINEILDEIFTYLADKNGRWRIRFFYWKGYLHKPQAWKLMGRGEDFLYDTNPAGSEIAEFSETISLNLPDE